MRPFADRRAERTENEGNETRAVGSVGQDARQPGGVPVPGSSREVEASGLAVGAPRDQRHFQPVLGSVLTTGTGQVTSHGWTPPGPSNLNQVVVDGPSASSTPTAQLTPGAETPYAHRSHVLPLHPLRFATPLITGTSGPRRAATLDPVVLQSQPHMQSVLTDIPARPMRMPSLLYPSPSPNSGPLGVSPPGHTNRDDPVRDSGYPAPGSNYEDSTYLFIYCRCRSRSLMSDYTRPQR
jgi:hypothetical protein